MTPLGVLAASGPGILGVIVADLLGLYALAILAMALLSWFPLREGTTIWQVQRFLLRITDPVMLPVRRAMPSMGPLDVTPIIVLFTHPPRAEPDTGLRARSGSQDRGASAPRIGDMELTPKLLTDDVDFRIALRGYDKDEVDDFLERVAVAVGQLQEQLSSAVDRARKAEARAQQVQASPPKVEAPAESPTVATGEGADELNEELRRTLVLAQRTADAAIREAREEAARITTEADEQRTRTLESASAESQRASDEAKGRLLAELAELEAVRNGLQADITVLDRHLGEHRAKVRETVQVLRRLVDDPQSFTVQPAPPLNVDTVPTAPADSPRRARGRGRQ